MARSDTLILQVTDFKDPQHWRWVLKDESGRFLQDQEVCLDPADPNYLALQDLQTYLDSYSSPDKRVTDQLEILDDMSIWIGSTLLGKIAGRLAQYRTPITVRVLALSEASGITYLPLELAKIGDRPLALQDISLVFEIADSEPIEKEKVGEKLRILAIFSLPTDVSALALRRERYTLMRLIDRIAQTHNLAIEMRVLQYGVTREILREALEECKGWDMIHLSGHGEAATVILEKSDGTKDYVSSKDLADLLSLAQGKLKFVALSSCLSAAATLEESLKWLKLWKPEMAQETSSPVESDGDPMPALARQLVESTDCAVLAMRYTVGDEFAVTLAKELYERMLGKGQTLPRALQHSLRVALSGDYGAASPPLSIATPALFGRRAAELIIKPPRAQKGEFKMPTVGLAYFPSEPLRFVGRSGPLVRSSSALAPDSDKRGVLFYGMAGAGKTACALELAYHHYRSHRFQGFVWYKAPDEGKDIDRAMLDLAIDMETQLSGFKMVHVVDDLAAFKKFLPLMKQFLESNSILIMLDNLESLLTSQGTWRDERWKLLIDALQEHNGYSRVTLTSRWLPHELKGERILIETIHSLSLNEAIILAREMPNLGRMLAGRGTVALEKDRELVTRTLELVQGHPMLIKFAEEQAKDPAVLEKYLERAAQVWGNESKLESFFDVGESSQDAGKFLVVLKGWTRNLSESLPEAARTLFHFLCAMEGADRQSRIVILIWPELWKHLHLTGLAHDIEKTLENLKPLVEVQALGGDSRYSIHPGVAEAGLLELEEGFQKAVDRELASFWGAMLGKASEYEMKGKGRLVVQAGLRSAPYLMRLGQWKQAANYLQMTLDRDRSPNTAFIATAMLNHIAMAANRPKEKMMCEGILAKALHQAGRRQEAKDILRLLISKYAERSDFRNALACESELFKILMESGQFKMAQELAEKTKGYAHRANLGPWTQLANKVQRLEALNKQGMYREVIDIVEALMEKVESLPERGNRKEAVATWNVKEAILEVGRDASIRMQHYDHALELNEMLLKIQKSRGATELTLARTAFNDYFPLLNLKRYEQAEILIGSCREVFTKEKDIRGLGAVFSSLASLQEGLNRIEGAAKFEEIALRYNYQTHNTEAISISHEHLGWYLFKSGSHKATSHSLAAGIINYLTGSGLLASNFQKVFISVVQFESQTIPATFDQLCHIVEEVEGVKFKELFLSLAEPDANGDKVMQEVVKIAQQTYMGTH